MIDNLARTSHQAFATVGLQPIDPNPLLSVCQPGESDSEHGTASAGVFVGSYSTAQDAPLAAYSVKALGRGVGADGTTGCDVGNASHVANALAIVQMESVPGDVINMSLGGSTLSGFIEMQVQQLLNTGRVVVAAAGNETQAVSYPPANIPDVLTIGATDQNDARWVSLFIPGEGSNFGPEVEAYAPGFQVLAPTDSSDSDTRDDFAGTSMSAPLVAGVVFHGVATTTASWPPPQSISVAREQARLLATQGVSRGADVLPVMRGRPLEKSPVQGIAPAYAGVWGDRLLADGIGGLWRGRNGASGNSLGRLTLGPNGFPSPSGTFTAMRTEDEKCLALAGFDYGFMPNSDAELLVGCHGTGTAYLGLYSAQGEERFYSVEPEDAPLHARTYTSADVLPAYGAVVGAMRQRGGTFEPQLATLLLLNRDNNGSPLTPTRRELVPSAGRSIHIDDVAIRCGNTGPASFAECVAYAVTTQHHGGSNQVSIVVYRVTFLPDPTISVTEEPAIVAQHTLTPPMDCGVSGVGIGYGAQGVGVVPDDNGLGFSVVYTLSGTELVNGTCLLGGGTYIARANQAHADARRLGEGFFASELSFNDSNRTVMLAGQLHDRLFFASVPAIVSMDRALYPRSTWQPPLSASTFSVFGLELSGAYKGFFVQGDSALQSSVSWFEP